MIEIIEVSLIDNSSNVIITILDEPSKQNLMIVHGKYFSQQFRVNDIDVKIRIHEKVMTLEIMGVDFDAHQSLFLAPEKFVELQLFFKEAGFPMPLMG